MSELYAICFQAVVLKPRIVWTKSKPLEDDIFTVEICIFFVRRRKSFPILLSASYFFSQQVRSQRKFFKTSNLPRNILISSVFLVRLKVPNDISL